MRLFGSLLLAAWMTSLAVGDASAASTNEPPVLLARAGERAVAVGIVRDADYVVVPIHAVGDSKMSLSPGGDEARQALEHIVRKASVHERFRVLRGAAVLGQDGSRQAQAIFTGGSHGRSEVRILVPLAAEGDLDSAAAEVARFLESSRLPGRARVEAGPPQLAVRDPESHRTTIVRAIGRDLNRVRGDLGLSHVRVGGLESPVQARQLDSRRVELTINYTMTVTDQQ